MTQQDVRQPYPQGSIVLVDLSAEGNRREIRPCVVVKFIRLYVDGRRTNLYPVVPLSPLEFSVGEKSPRLPARDGGLPAPSTALCVFFRTVNAQRVLGYVGKLTPDEYIPVARGLLALVGS